MFGKRKPKQQPSRRVLGYVDLAIHTPPPAPIVVTSKPKTNNEGDNQ